MESYKAVIVIAALIVLTAALMIISKNRENRNRFLKKIGDGWGKLPKNAHTAEEAEGISRYFRDTAAKSGADIIDDITWNDCDMDRIFQTVNAAFSSPGEEILYKWLRTPLTDPDALSRRDEIISYYAEHADKRRSILEILNRVGRVKKMSYYEHLIRLRDAEKIGSGKYIILCALMFIGIGLLFINPVAALAVLLPVMAANIVVYLRQKEHMEVPIRSFSCLLRLLDAAGRLISGNDDITDQYKTELKELRGKFASFQRGSFFVTSSAHTGTGMGDALLEYLKILFHFDLIKYDQMIDSCRGLEDAYMRMYEIVGTLDAAIAAASFREYLPVWCRPELVNAPDGFIDTEEMYHPLLKDPVPVSFSARGGILVTGSNASGKSTFLKCNAISSILAQSIFTVPAKSFRASCFCILTSMALRDDIQSGESYFIVEIRSLKRILDAVSGGSVPVLGIVDEVLRGTNTVERIAASSQILNRLVDGNAVILAATHDIELAGILEKSYRNCHFTETIKDGDVVFDYRLHEGRAISRNAIALLEACGYGKELADAARSEAERFEETGEWRL